MLIKSWLPGSNDFILFLGGDLTHFSDRTCANADPPSCAVELCRIKAVQIYGGTERLSHLECLSIHTVTQPALDSESKELISSSYISTMW